MTKLIGVVKAKDEERLVGSGFISGQTRKEYFIEIPAANFQQLEEESLTSVGCNKIEEIENGAIIIVSCDETAKSIYTFLVDHCSEACNIEKGLHFHKTKKRLFLRTYIVL